MLFLQKAKLKIKHGLQAPEKEPVKKMQKKSPKKKLMKTKTTTRTSPEKTSTENSIPKSARQPVESDNRVVQVIDKVLMPSYTLGDDQCKLKIKKKTLATNYCVWYRIESKFY